MAMLKRGMSGEPVRRLQAKLGVSADGAFGPRTQAALEAYQKANGLAVDGIAGPDTFTHMGLYELILLRQGTSGEAVKKLQAALGISADGKFGPGTAKAVKDYQAKNGLDADGIAGPVTLAKLGVFAEITPAVLSYSRVSEAAVEAWHAATDAAKPGEDPKAPAAAPPFAQADAAGGAGKSIWATIKGFFS